MTQFIRSRRWHIYTLPVDNSYAAANIELWLVGFRIAVLFTPPTFISILGVPFPPVRSSLCNIFWNVVGSLLHHFGHQCHCTSTNALSNMWLTRRFLRYLVHVTCAASSAYLPKNKMLDWQKRYPCYKCYYFLTLYVPCIVLQCVDKPTRCHTSYEWSLLFIICRPG